MILETSEVTHNGGFGEKLTGFESVHLNITFTFVNEKLKQKLKIIKIDNKAPRQMVEHWGDKQKHCTIPGQRLKFSPKPVHDLSYVLVQIPDMKNFL